MSQLAEQVKPDRRILRRINELIPIFAPFKI